MTSGMTAVRENRSLLFILMFLIGILTTAAYLRLAQCGYISFDDAVYVIENDHIKTGFSLETIKWAFITRTDGNWFPLTWLSYILDVSIAGSSPRTYHLSNLFYHIVNSLLLLFVLFWLTGHLYRSAFVAALFALHPLHVESVAWVSERKDLLSTLFLLLTMISYAWYRERQAVVWYLVTVMLFACGLMAKPMLVTLPFLLLFLDFWPFRKYDSLGTKSFLYVLVEKIPFIILAIISSVITYNVQKHGAVVSYAESPLLLNIKNALLSYVLYIYKTFVPVGLAVIYPFKTEISSLAACAAAAGLLFVTGVALKCRNNKPYLMVGWCWYLMALVPVIGIVRVGKQSMADRYTYIPHIGLFMFLVWGAAELGYVQRLNRKVKVVVVAGILSLLAVFTGNQVLYWRTSTSLFKRTIEVTENNWLALGILGFDYISCNELDKALVLLNRSLALNPKNVMALYNMGILHNKLGNKLVAIDYFNKTLSIDPDYRLAYYQIGLQLLYSGDTAGALHQHEILEGLDSNLARQLMTQILIKNG